MNYSIPILVVSCLFAACGGPTLPQKGAKDQGEIQNDPGDRDRGGDSDIEAGDTDSLSGDFDSGDTNPGGDATPSGDTDQNGDDLVAGDFDLGAGDADAGGDSVSPGDSATGGDAESGVWQCDPEYFGGDDGCDCGCGEPDPDCDTGLGCGEPGCDAVGCGYCYDAEGAIRDCASQAPPGWTCDAEYYATGDGCDCGCGVEDLDCAGGGCTGPDCYVAECTFCNPGDCPG